MLGSSLRYHWWSLILVFACVWSGKAFLINRYCLSWIWLAETNPREGHLVLIRPDLALEVGLFPFGLGFLYFKVLKGQRLTSAYTLFIAASQQSIYTLTSCDPLLFNSG